jgi:hypothetical protein
MGDRGGFSSCTRPRLLRLTPRILDSCSAPSRKLWKGVSSEAGTGASTEISIRHAKKMISLNTHQSFLRISQPASESSLEPSGYFNDFGRQHETIQYEGMHKPKKKNEEAKNKQSTKTSINLVFIFSGSSSPINPVYTRCVDFSL